MPTSRLGPDERRCRPGRRLRAVGSRGRGGSARARRRDRGRHTGGVAGDEPHDRSGRGGPDDGAGPGGPGGERDRLPAGGLPSILRRGVAGRGRVGGAPPHRRRPPPRRSARNAAGRGGQLHRRWNVCPRAGIILRGSRHHLERPGAGPPGRWERGRLVPAAAAVGALAARSGGRTAARARSHRSVGRAGQADAVPQRCLGARRGENRMMGRHVGRWTAALALAATAVTVGGSAPPALAHDTGGLFQPRVSDLVVQDSGTAGERDVWLRVVDADSGTPAEGMRTTLATPKAAVPLAEVGLGYFSGSAPVDPGPTRLTVTVEAAPGGPLSKRFTTSWTVDIPPLGQRKVVAGSGNQAG